MGNLKDRLTEEEWNAVEDRVPAQLIILGLPCSGQEKIEEILSGMGLKSIKDFNSVCWMIMDSVEGSALLRNNMSKIAENDGVFSSGAICYSLEHWLPLMSNPKIILLDRDYKEAEKEFGANLQEFLVAKAKLLSNGFSCPVMKLNYEDIVDYPKRANKRLEGFI